MGYEDKLVMSKCFACVWKDRWWLLMDVQQNTRSTWELSSCDWGSFRQNKERGLPALTLPWRNKRKLRPVYSIALLLKLVIKVDEGTSFSKSILGLGLSGTAENSAFNNFTSHLVIDPTTLTTDVLNEFQRLFPANNSVLGAPFNTGDSLFDRGSAWWYTDMMFLSPRRLFFQNGAALQPMFAYYFAELIPGNNPTFGSK